MCADRLTQAVRHQLGLGRLLPLGDAGDGAWLTEETARTVLRRAAAHAMPSVRLDALHLSSAGSEGADEPPAPAVPPPPSALPPGPIRLEGELAVTVEEPLPVVTEALRKLLLTTADRKLGLPIGPADLRVTDLLLEAPGTGPEAGPAADSGPGAGEENGAARDSGEAGEGTADGTPDGTEDDLASAVAGAVLAAPGVARMAPVLGSPLTVTAGASAARAVRISGGEGGGDGWNGAGEAAAARAASPPHVLLQIAVAPGHRALDVARGARAAAAEAAEAAVREVTVAVLVTAVDPD